MFQTEFLRALQSHASGWLTFVMKGVTTTGYDWFFILLLLAVMFGMNFRRGIFLFQLIIGNAIIIEGAKHLCGLPRPPWVDTGVFNLEFSEPNLSPFTRMGARGFFEPLPGEVVASFRSTGGSYGFPSGHVAGTIVTWGGIAVLFRKRVLLFLLPLLALVMALSRMYLGRHFLADVVGGAVAGSVVLLAGSFILSRRSWSDRFFEAASSSVHGVLTQLIRGTVFIGVPVVLALGTPVEPSLLGYLAGVNAAFSAVLLTGLPDDRGTILQRCGRVVLGMVLFAGAAVGVGFGKRALGLVDDLGAVRFLSAALPGFFGVGATVVLGRVLGWYRESPGSPE